MERIVLDTNVLVAAAYSATSASRRIADACLRHELVAVASGAVKKEYRRILARAVRSPEYQPQLAELLDGLELAEPDEVPRVVDEDPEDDKFLAAALAGGAGWLVTNDRHLLGLDPYRSVRIVTPPAFAERMPAREETKNPDDT